jgi:hypothetical protein
MNWRRGLFRLWIVGTALFVIAVAFVSYSEITKQFDDAATIAAHGTAGLDPSKDQLTSERAAQLGVSGWTDYEVGIGPPPAPWATLGW